MHTTTRKARLLWAVLALSAATAATAATAVADDAIGRTASPAASGARRFGIQAEAGVPDGATASLVIRPIRALRVHVGAAYNGVTVGEAAGLTLIPLSWWCAPTVSVDVGHYPEGDANPLARTILQDPTYASSMLDHVGYDYLDAHVGLELGRSWATFYVHAGMSLATGRIHGLSDPDKGVTFTDDPRATVWAPSVKVGLIVYALQ
jgi:hypothetical protein